MYSLFKVYLLIHKVYRILCYLRLCVYQNFTLSISKIFLRMYVFFFSKVCWCLRDISAEICLKNLLKRIRYSSQSNSNWWLFCWCSRQYRPCICRFHTKMGYRISSSRPRRRFCITINRPRRWRYWYNGERLRVLLQLGWTHTSRCNPSLFAYADFSVRLDPCIQFALVRGHRGHWWNSVTMVLSSFSFPVASLVSSFFSAIFSLLSFSSLFLLVRTVKSKVLRPIVDWSVGWFDGWPVGWTT